MTGRAARQHAAIAGIFVTVLALGSPASAQGQSTPAEVLTVGADGAVLLPLGNFAKFSGAGLGPMARVEFRFDPVWTFTARGGFFYHTTKPNSSRTTELPLLLGAKMFFDTPGHGWYAAAEGGWLNVTYHSKASGVFETPLPQDGTELVVSEWKVGVTATAGYRIAPLDLRAGFLFGSLRHPSELAALMASVGYEIPIL